MRAHIRGLTCARNAWRARSPKHGPNGRRPNHHTPHTQSRKHSRSMQTKATKRQIHKTQTLTLQQTLEAKPGLTELAAPCGLSCTACKLYIRTKCKGCRTKRNPQCTIWKCAEERGLNYCGECSDFPCENNYATPAIAKEWLDELKELFKNQN